MRLTIFIMVSSKEGLELEPDLHKGRFAMSLLRGISVYVCLEEKRICKVDYLWSCVRCFGGVRELNSLGGRSGVRVSQLVGKGQRLCIWGGHFLQGPEV